MKNFTRAVTVLVSSAALVGASLMGAAGAMAAPGDVSEVGLAAGSTPRDVAEGPDGNMWVTGGASNTIAKVSMTGGVTAYALPLPANVSNPWSIAAGPDGNMWFTLRSGGKIGRITTSGAVSFINLPDASMQPQDITAGPGNNMWFTELGGRIGRVTMAGAVSMFTVPWANSQPHSIAAGPATVDGLYFTDSGADRVGFVVSDGSIYPNQVLIADSAPSGIVNVDDAMWFVMSGTNKLAKILQRDSLLETSVAGAPTAIAKGVGNTMWISLSARNSVAKYSVQGAPLAVYPLTSPNSLPAGLAEGPDTNVWVAQTNAGKIARVLSGQVPVATSAPSITPATGVKAGTMVTASEGRGTTPCDLHISVASVLERCRCQLVREYRRGHIEDLRGHGAEHNQYLRVGVQAVNRSGPGSPSTPRSSVWEQFLRPRPRRSPAGRPSSSPRV